MDHASEANLSGLNYLAGFLQARDSARAQFSSEDCLTSTVKMRLSDTVLRLNHRKRRLADEAGIPGEESVIINGL
jgi:hypothetical protein